MRRLNALSMEHDHRRRMTRMVAVATQYQKGVPIAKISEEFQIAQATVTKYARTLGCAKRRPGADPRVRRAVAKDYAEGVPIKQICAAHGVERKTLWVICKEAGLPLRQPKGNSHGK